MKDGRINWGSQSLSQEVSKIFTKGVIHLDLWLQASLAAPKASVGKNVVQGREGKQKQCVVAREQLRANTCPLALITKRIMQVVLEKVVL